MNELVKKAKITILPAQEKCGLGSRPMHVE